MLKYSIAYRDVIAMSKVSFPIIFCKGEWYGGRFFVLTTYPFESDATIVVPHDSQTSGSASDLSCGW